jgi:phosphatidylglycerophosphate synthase
MVTLGANDNDDARPAGRFGVLDPRHWHDQQRPRLRLRRGVYLLPSLFTMGNMFCGYLCVLYAIRGEFAIAAPFIGVAVVLDMLDGRIARMTGTATAFGVEFDSLADVISFGIAPAVLVFLWGLQPLHRLGWAVGFIYLTAAATSATSLACRAPPRRRFRPRRSSSIRLASAIPGGRWSRWRSWSCLRC